VALLRLPVQARLEGYLTTVKINTDCRKTTTMTEKATGDGAAHISPL
jgi:hypothetical protein